MTNRGLEIRLRVTWKLRGGDLIALLHSGEDRYASIGISIALMKDGRFIRTEADKWKVFGDPIDEEYKKPALETLYIPQLYLPEKPPQPVFRFLVYEASSNYKVQKFAWVKRVSSAIKPSSMFNFSSIDKTIPWSPALAPCRANRDPSLKGTLHVIL